MPLENTNLHDVATQGLLAGALGFLGRMLALANMPVRPSGLALLVTLLWEIPVAMAMGVIGLALVDWADLHGNIAYATVIAVAYGGPRSISFVLARWLNRNTPLV